MTKLDPKNRLMENFWPGLLTGNTALDPHLSFVFVTGNAYHFPKNKWCLNLLLFSGFINKQKMCFWGPATKMHWSVRSEIWKNEREGPRSTHSTVEISRTC